jgi:hypothetical protein
MTRAQPSLRAETRRLRRAFVAILLTAAPAAAIEGCAGSEGAGSGGGRHVEDAPDAHADGPWSADASRDVIADGTGDAVSDAGDASEASDAASDGFDPACDSTVRGADGGPDASDACIITLPCGVPQGLTLMGCDLYVEGLPFGCSVIPDAGCEDGDVVTPNGLLIVDCAACPVGGGRRPSGLLSPIIEADSTLGAYFARMAHEEAASILAFGRMGEELGRHGAPASLRRAALRCARDEARHARVMTRRARASGARSTRPRIRRAQRRSLEAFARENAVEGCVKEAFGALVLAWQASHAADVELRATFARVAADEARHAAFAWTVARWADERLPSAGRARVAGAARGAIRERRAGRQTSAVDVLLGKPGLTARGGLLEGLAAALDLGSGRGRSR